MLIGRVIFGFSIGLITVAIPRLIEEIAPADKIAPMQAIFLFSSTVGSLLATSLGAILPDENDKEALENDQLWRLIFGFPIPFYILLLAGMFFYIKTDSPKYLLM